MRFRGQVLGAKLIQLCLIPHARVVMCREQQRLDRIAKEGSDRYAPKEAEVSKRPPEEE